MTKKRLFMTKNVDILDFSGGGGGVKYNYNAFYYIYSN